MRGRKWIKNVRPDQPLSEIASRVVSERLKIVHHYLRLAALEHDKDIEFVHQLRVSTRRAKSALLAFADVLPSKRSVWLGKRLKQMRREAGVARDLDVMCERLLRDAGENPDDALLGIVGSLKQQRRRAQKPLKRTWKRMKKDRFRRKIHALSTRVHWRGKGKEPSFHQAAVGSLRPVVHAFFAAGEADLAIDENLHSLRLAGKNLRYSIEMLSSAFDPKLKQEIYPVFANMQESLGDINDHLVAKSVFESWLVQSNDRKSMEAIAKLITVERDAYLKSRDQFHQWWTTEAVNRLKQQFDRLLNDNSRGPSVSAQLA